MEEKYIIDNVASHIPMLDLIKRLLKARKILEFGCGIYSTNKFLEFEGLELLVSYEDSKPWFDRVKKIPDARLDLRFGGDLLNVARTVCLDDFDLIFIDCCDSTRDSKPERAAVIKAVGERRPKAIVVVHDFDDEIDRFPWAVEDFDNRMVYSGLWPSTGILWNQVEGSATVRNVRFVGPQGVLDL